MTGSTRRRQRNGGALAKSRTELWTTEYVRLESWSLIQRRLGPQAVMAFQDD
jgi:hypothetical protein